MTIIEAAQNRWRSALSSLLFLIIAGSVAYVIIPKESDPDITIPVMYVSLAHTGISPADAERMLVRPVEDELKSIEGIKELRAASYQGGGYVLLEFEAGFDPDRALDDVREAVDLVKPDLPDESEEPTVNEVNLSLFPVLNVALHGDLPVRDLQRLARELADAIETVPQVLEVEEVGRLEEQVEILVDPKMLETYQIRLSEMLGIVNSGNQLIAAGAVENTSGNFNVKLPGLIETADDLLAFPLAAEGDGAVLLSDIATIRAGYKDPENLARTFANPAIVLKVVKRTGKNIIDTITNVRSVVEQVSQNWPPGVVTTISQDQSSNIRDMLQSLQNNVMSAVLLVMVVIIAILGIRSGLLVGVAIPGSFLTGIMVLYALGITVNVVVLFSLILSVGILVDGAIVVSEFADRKLRQNFAPQAAYSLAARRMAWPIIASTATTLAAFAPLLFWPGIVGEFMKFLPLTLIAVLSASLMMALFFLPILGTRLLLLQSWIGRLLRRKSNPKLNPKPNRQIDDDEPMELPTTGLAGRYVRLLRIVVRWPLLVLGLAFGSMISVIIIYSNYGQSVEFFPEVDPEQISLHVGAQGNLSITEQSELVRLAEARILAIHEANGEFLNITSLIGSTGGDNERAADVIGVIDMELLNWRERRATKTIIEEVRSAVRDIPGLRFELRYDRAGPTSGKPVHLELIGGTAEGRIQAVHQIRSYLEQEQAFVDIEDSLPLPGIEWLLDIDRAQALKFGADVELVGQLVKLVTRGFKLTEYRPENSRDEVDIIARAPYQYRSLDELDALRTTTASGTVPISNFITRMPSQRTGTLHRVDGKAIQFVKADVATDVLPDDAVTQLRGWLEAEQLPNGVAVRFKGEDQDQKEAQAFLVKAFTVAMFLMGVILLTQFNSFWSALVILTAVALSSTGVLIGLLITGRPFGIVMSGIGTIALAGIIVNNNIVLIDTYDRLRKQTGNALEALLQTGAQRLRPVLLTSVTTILGLIPMVTQINLDFAGQVIEVGGPST
ncbi:MAG: efflux RND transporter permease subunit, partial [Pseudomonadota bacterium]